MEYQQEHLDRASGSLDHISIGEWITVTELGANHGVGPKKTRAILHHIGVLAHEGRRYRLPRNLVTAGIGLRHDRPKSGYPFDVISPKGQGMIASAWSSAADDYEQEGQQQPLIVRVRADIDAFKALRRGSLDTRQEVIWVLDHFPDILNQTAAVALEISPALVSRYATARSTERRVQQERRDKPLAPEGLGILSRPRFSGRSEIAPVERGGSPDG
jgi:hypothetical protein